jgi:hypothetical protein
MMVASVISATWEEAGVREAKFGTHRKKIAS